MQWNSEDVRMAFRIFVQLLNNGETKDRELLQAYGEGEVRLILEEIVEREADVKIFATQDSLCITPGVDNKIFGYRNAELRSAMKLKDNSQLYLAYFVILCMLARFYNSDDQSLSARQFLPLEELEKMVTEQIEEILLAKEERGEELASFEEETAICLSQVASTWQELPAFDDRKKNLRQARNNRISFLLQVFSFLEEEGLLQILENREIRLMKKMEHLVMKYYFHSRRKDFLLSLLQTPLREGIRNHRGGVPIAADTADSSNQYPV